MKQKIIVLLLTGLMILSVSISGCGNSDSKKKDKEEDIKVEEESDLDKLKEARANMTDEEWNALVDQAANEAMKKEFPDAGESSESDSKDNSSGSYSDRTLTTKDCTIKITDYKVIHEGDEGYEEFNEGPVIVFWFDITNVSGEELEASDWISYVEAYQDNDPNIENKLDMGYYIDEATNDNSFQKIKKGGTVHDCYTYKLTDDTTPVTLKFKGELFGDTVGEEDFSIQ